jgi:hypothetical protein
VDKRYSAIVDTSTKEYNVKVRWFTHKDPSIIIDPDIEDAKRLANLRLTAETIEEA